MKKKLEWLKETDLLQRTSFGTIAELIGENGSISFKKRNLARQDKRVFVTLKSKKGARQVICSQPVSEMIRSKELSLAQLLDFELLLVINEQGEERYVISFPEDANGELEVKASAKREVFQPEELEEWEEVQY